MDSQKIHPFDYILGYDASGHMSRMKTVLYGSLANRSLNEDELEIFNRERRRILRYIKDYYDTVENTGSKDEYATGIEPETRKAHLPQLKKSSITYWLDHYERLENLLSQEEKETIQELRKRFDIK